ncbi:MAG: DUF1566 domain-containing protein [Spirochaetes bacterium]|nr:DUF1566 domain-containing protein [Spirochaetota bacterium]
MLLFGLSNCQSWGKFWLDGSITSFSFEPQNTHLTNSIAGVISGDQIRVTLPYGVNLSALVATFAARAETISVNGVPQQSGQTADNFLLPVVYTLTAPHITHNYTVTVYQSALVNDTGQSNCYDASSLQPCSVTAASFPGQDADFSNVPAQRLMQPQSTNAAFPNDYFNIDLLSGVAWKACDEGLTGSTCLSGTVTTAGQTAAVTACSALNAQNSGAGYAGLTNWRLPTFRELFQFQKYDVNGVYIDTNLFGGPTAATHWTSNLILPAASTALAITTGMSANGVGALANIRCVAGGAYPQPDWADNGDGTVSEKRSGLIFQKCAYGLTNNATCSGTMTAGNWATALSYCHSLSLGGRSWRLPNLNEMIVLVDPTRTAAPYINPVYFPNIPLDGALAYEFWTSTTAPNNGNYPYVLNFTTPNVGNIDAKGATVTGSNSYHARCVSSQ